MINALYVENNGVYSNIPGVDCWAVDRDARTCKNGAPAICHPPCERWGRYWGGGPMLHGTEKQKLLGDDDGCFAHALWYVREFSGVIEHPEGSHAWKYFGLSIPPKTGGWIKADNYGGFTCCVEQGNYGHKARKATWLYINGLSPKELIWGAAEGKSRIDEGFHSKRTALDARAQSNFNPVKRLSAKERIDTPVEFRDLLIDLVSSENAQEQ